MAKIKQLLERGQKIYPLTSSEAVVTKDNIVLTEKLEDMENSSVKAQIIGELYPEVDPGEYATTEEVSQLQQEVSGNLMSARAKNALMAVFQKVAFTVPEVSDEIAELNNALFNLDELVGIEAEYTQGSTVIWSDGVSSPNDLLPGLVVNAVYGDGTRVPVASGYTLSGTLTVGTSTIMVEYQGFTDTFNVVVTLYGSKTSYVLSDGAAIAYAFSQHESLYYRIDGASTTRKHFFLAYGTHKMKNASGVETQYYPLPVPKTATKVVVTITQSTLKIGGYFIKWNPEINEYVAALSTQSFTTGGFTKTLDQDGTTQVYYVPGIAPASGNIPSGQPTAITIEFNNE